MIAEEEGSAGCYVRDERKARRDARGESLESLDAMNIRDVGASRDQTSPVWKEPNSYAPRING
jgi:hypothetical protein